VAPQDLTLSGERSSSTPRMPTPAPMDPVPAGLRDDLADLLTRVLDLQSKVARHLEDGQPGQAQPPPEDASVRCYSVKEVARLLKLGLSRTYEHIETGAIPALRIGGRWLVPHQALVRLLEDKLEERRRATENAEVVG
jgi:excisionase family DNA binding protein